MKPLDHAKKMARELRRLANVEGFSHSAAQAAMARILGYRDWHDLHSKCDHQPGDEAARRQRTILELVAIDSASNHDAVAAALFPSVNANADFAGDILLIGDINYVADTPEAQSAMEDFAQHLGLRELPRAQPQSSKWVLPEEQPIARKPIETIMQAVALLADRGGKQYVTLRLRDEKGVERCKIRKSNGSILEIVEKKDVPPPPPRKKAVEISQDPSDWCKLVITSRRPISSIDMEMEIDFLMYCAELSRPRVYSRISPHLMTVPASSREHAIALASCIEGGTISKYDITLTIEHGDVSIAICDEDIMRMGQHVAKIRDYNDNEKERHRRENPEEIITFHPEYGNIENDANEEEEDYDDGDDDHENGLNDDLVVSLSSVLYDLNPDQAMGSDLMDMIDCIASHLTDSHPVISYDAMAGFDEADIIYHQAPQEKLGRNSRRGDLARYRTPVPMMAFETLVVVEAGRKLVRFKEDRVMLAILEEINSDGGCTVTIGWFDRIPKAASRSMTVKEHGLMDQVYQIGEFTNDSLTQDQMGLKERGNYKGVRIESWEPSF